MGAEVGAISIVFNDRSSTYLVIIHTETEETQVPLLRIVASVSERYPYGDGEFLPRQHNRLLAAASQRQTSRLGVGTRRNIRIRYKKREINIRSDQVVARRAREKSRI